jgi:hypothetical protein
MAQEAVKEPLDEKKLPHRLWLYILLAAVPIALITLYYIYNNRTDIMDWVDAYIASPYREAAATVSSLGPLRYFSLAEVLITLLVLWVLYYLVRTVIILITRPQKLLHLGKRLFTMLVVFLYIFAVYSWSWGAGYYGTDLAGQTGLRSDGITTEQLGNVTRLFAEKANELADEVERDDDGHFVADTDYFLEASKGVYTNIVREFPVLEGRAYPPKPMLYSKLMSIMNFTGVYISLTGEANVNVDAPAALVPATIAHEMAHQRGVNSEDEANFAGIAAAITSNITVYEYSGYLSGFLYLISALDTADPATAGAIRATLNDDVLRDWTDNYEYWKQYETPVAEAVSVMYDGYLKANGEELGISSYGACVDMLVSWLDKSPQP